MQAQNPPVTPAWAFGHIVWEDSINTSFGANKIVEGYLERGIPVDAVIIDSPWSESYNDFNWDTTRYAEPQKLINGLNDKGVKVILWLTGNINDKCKDTRLQKAPTYDYVRNNNFGVNNSTPYTWWKGHGLHLDFTNSKAVKWWYSQLDKVFGSGVYGWKVDQGEFWLGDVIETSKGRMSNEKFRPYYYDAMFDYTVSHRPEGIIIARPYSHQGGFEASVSKLNMGWCGDFGGDWQGLKEQISNIYRSALHGYGAIGCEVGGFYRSRASLKQFVRYIQFGCMTACIINGGENGAFTNHLPWFHGKEVEDIYKSCVMLHRELRPYMFSTVVDAHLRGGSLLKNTSLSEESHQLGDYIFTKAITSGSDEVSFSLPAEGRWIDFRTGRVHDAGSIISQTFSLNEFPLYIKAGAIIPFDPAATGGAFCDGTIKSERAVAVWPSGRSVRVLHLPDGEGTAYHDCKVDYDMQAGRLRVLNDRSESITFVINGVRSVSSVSGSAGWKFYPRSNRLEINVGDRNAVVSIKAAYI